MSLGKTAGTWLAGPVCARLMVWILLTVMTRPGREQVLGRLATEEAMLWTIAVLLVLLWCLGMVTSYTIYGFIHLLLVLAVIMVLIRIIQGRRPL